ncbi:uncharacterized protein LOC108912779 [Anoplophora glabripennis]|uniref:uncharacterized protein LOC108912779 n=1 Tax=Anoplophora glabripennis TaxID=217634 RepID=UPI000874B3FC|nr:uncharacterized protein LOC108912779 [Anoplophora glabripennis]
MTCVNLKHEKLSNPENSSLYPSIVDLSSTLKQDENLIQKASSTPINENQGKKLDDNAELNFLSTDNACDKVEWSEVVAETAVTVKKVEEYIYDDYDTFNKEEYNQISDGSKSRNSLMHKVSKIGWTYTPENSAREKNKECSTNHSELDDTYVRFEDVFDENGKYKSNGCDDSNECEVKGKGLNITFKKCYDSKIPLCNNSSLRSANSAYGNEGKSKKSLNFKRFKLKLDFLKVLTPKKSTYSTPSYDSIESKVKYKKIKNIKSSTL